ncbi:MAG: DUF58 domain-containing protein [Myxococcota bacterium]
MKLNALWRRLWRNAPRQLRFTRAGRVVVGLALATGFAAINTGNNLLFLAWGLVLSGIVVSGVLSELALRGLSVDALLPKDARAHVPFALPVRLTNGARRFAALGLDVRARLVAPDGGQEVAAAPFVLRLSAGASHEALARANLEQRGKYTVDEIVVETMYPFGFFVKARPFKRMPPPAFWVAPRLVDVRGLAVEVAGRRGSAAANVAGTGEDYFAMRAFRTGDDLRRIKWRRSAKVGRWLVAETEAIAGHDVVIELALSRRAESEDIELAIATAGSLAEALLEMGTRVGLRGPGTMVTSDVGPGHAWTILRALAALDPQQPSLGGVVGRTTTLVAVCAGEVSVHADHIVRVGGAPEEQVA